MLLVGRLVYEKGFHLALDALPGLIRRVGKVRFLIAGSGTAEAELKAQAERLGLMEHGTFIGWTRRRRPAFALPDRRPVPRALDLRAVRARRAGGDGERLPDASSPTRAGCARSSRAGAGSGCASAPSSVRSLERMAQQLLTDDELRDRLVAEASEHVLRFDWADVARQTAAVYERLVASPHDGVGLHRRARRGSWSPRRPRRASRSSRARPRARRAATPGCGVDRALDVGERRRRVLDRRPVADHGALADRHARVARRSPRARTAARPRPTFTVPACAEMRASGPMTTPRPTDHPRAARHLDRGAVRSISTPGPMESPRRLSGTAPTLQAVEMLHAR